MLPEARAFDSSWEGSTFDSTGTRAAYTKELASIHFTPYSLLYGEYGDVLSAIDRSVRPYNVVVWLSCLSEALPALAP